MLPISLHDDTLHIGALAVSFQRTLRLPDDGRDYPLPPGLGRFPLRRVEDYRERVPESWRVSGGVFLPMYQREAMWLSFGADWPPVALKVGLGKRNALTGEPWSDRLDVRRQDYLVCPDQPWLDGIKAGEGIVKQFVAMPLSLGYTVEGQLSGDETVGGLQLLAYSARPERLPERPAMADFGAMPCVAEGAELGIAAGGRMRQKVYPDEYGVETWDLAHSGRVFVHIADSLAWREITREEPPPTPVSADTYSEHGLPWFSLYDERRRDLTVPAKLRDVRSVRELDAERATRPQQDDSTVELEPGQVVELRPPASTVAAGDW